MRGGLPVSALHAFIRSPPTKEPTRLHPRPDELEGGRGGRRHDARAGPANQRGHERAGPQGVKGLAQGVVEGVVEDGGGDGHGEGRAEAAVQPGEALLPPDLWWWWLCL